MTLAYRSTHLRVPIVGALEVGVQATSPSQTTMQKYELFRN